MNFIDKCLRQVTFAWLLLGLAAPAGLLSAATVTRGPYLQQGTTNSVVVCWRTDVATASSVRSGVTPGNLTSLTSDAALVTNHVVTVTNLQPDTKYFYEIGAATEVFPGTTNDFFITAPPVGVPKPTRIWAIGDAGTGTSEAVAVRDAYAAFAGTRPTDVWLMLGDNAYDSGSDTEYQLNVFNIYPGIFRNAIVWPTIGNHDTGASGPGGDLVYIDIFTLPKNGEAGGVASGTEHYYSFDHANIHFLCLDTASSDRSSNSPMCNWARADLASTRQEWIIAYWHHPPYTKGSHDSDVESNLIEVRENMVPIMENYGVDLVLCGHSHSYERSYLIDGHYGSSFTFTPSMKKDGGDGRETGSGAYRKEAGGLGHQGIVYTVAGSSGKTGGGSLNHPAMFASLDELGSLVLDVTGSRLDMMFLKTNGAAGDFVTIIKGPPLTNAPVAPAGLAAIPVSATQINLSWTDSSDNEAGFKLEHSTNGVDFVQFQIVSAGVTNGTDTGLAPSNTYYYRVHSFNVVGDSPFSATAQATTLPATNGSADTIPPAAVTTLAVTGSTTNSVSLSWTAPGDDGNVGTATRYDLRYRAGPIAETNWASATQASGEPAPAAAGTLQTFTVAGLASGVTYYFALKTSDETNNLSPLSNVPTGTTTASSALPASPTNLRVTGVATNEIDLIWTDNATNESGFKVERSIDAVNFAQIMTTGVNATNATDAGVQPGSVNFYRVRAYNAAGDSPFSNTNGAQAIPPASTTFSVLIASNAVWKYLDNGTDQGAAWAARTFNDSTWASGPAILGYLGGHESTTVSYGGNASAKYITTYFRRHFTVSDPSSVTALTVSLLRDDGGVVYLNGAEVFRDNMPTGAVNYLTPAATSVSGTDKTSFHPSPPIDPGGLVPGDNVVAVELHQRSATSTSMDFALQLISTNRTGSSGSPTVTVLSSSLNPALTSDAVTFTAVVTNAQNGAVTVGTVIFIEGGTTVAGPTALNGSGRASFTTNGLSAGSHTLAANYNGSPGALNASLGTVTETVCSALMQTPLIGLSPASVCPNSTGNQALGPVGPITYSWTITNGTITSATNAQTVNYLAGARGSVGLTLRVSNALGCAGASSTNVPILVDTVPPTVTCPANIVTNSATGDCPVVVSFTVSGGVSCSLSNVVANPPSGSAFPVGTNVVMLTASDAAGHTNACTFRVIVRPGPAPLLTMVQGHGQMVFSWPAEFGCYKLQSTPALLSPLSASVWSPHPGPLQTNGGSIFATNSISSSNRFYRLAY